MQLNGLLQSGCKFYKINYFCMWTSYRVVMTQLIKLSKYKLSLKYFIYFQLLFLQNETNKETSKIIITLNDLIINIKYFSIKSKPFLIKLYNNFYFSILFKKPFSLLYFESVKLVYKFLNAFLKKINSK